MFDVQTHVGRGLITRFVLRLLAEGELVHVGVEQDREWFPWLCLDEVILDYV
ncbi:hypothetical protein U6G28_06425 [Actinomycetaceae bacterium MB13-C1-2]|nr:hypothetical protein U6G28_06425 [Actinomycetaceae bacterium MB13-C1-2]